MVVTGHRQGEQEYGYLSYYHHIIHTITEELGTCGLTTPFLFSSLALGVD
jgi:hypothetical protein